MRMRHITPIAAASLLVPTPALAHGGEIIGLLYGSPYLVPVVALLTIWSWGVGLRTKLLTIVATSIASAATFGVVLAVWRWDILSVFGVDLTLGILLGGALAEVVIPAFTWWACSRYVRRHNIA